MLENGKVESKLSEGEVVTMKKLLIGFAAVFLLFTFVEAPTSKASGKTVRVAVDNANIREEPSNTGTIIAQATRNDNFSVQDEQFGWYKIQLSNGKNGWIAGYLVVTDNGQKQETSVQQQQGTVTADSLFVRSEAALSGDVVGTLHKGDQVTIAGDEYGWKKIVYQNQEGWVNGRYLSTTEKSSNDSTPAPAAEQTQEVGNFAYIVTEGTNLRSKPNMSGEVMAKGSKGERYPIVGKEGDWYKINLVSGDEAYVAGWIVSSSKTDKPAQKAEPAKEQGSSLNGKTIVVDPGHGGHDPGTGLGTGIFEKQLNLQTAKLLEGKLQAAGANVVLTRTKDTHVGLDVRVDLSNKVADAFVSIHYDASLDKNISGFTVYYNQSHQQKLAQQMNKSLASHIDLKNRGTVPADYFVVRENNRPAVLLELGFLSNPGERAYVTTNEYQENVTSGIVQGLQAYFK